MMLGCQATSHNHQISAQENHVFDYGANMQITGLCQHIIDYGVRRQIIGLKAAVKRTFAATDSIASANCLLAVGLPSSTILLPFAIS